MPVLEDAGFRVAAPFIRGYAPSTVSGSGAYQTGASALDTCALHRHFRGDDRAILIGHDWGAPIVYGAASIEPPGGTAMATTFAQRLGSIDAAP